MYSRIARRYGSSASSDMPMPSAASSAGTTELCAPVSPKYRSARQSPPTTPPPAPARTPSYERPAAGIASCVHPPMNERTHRW